MGQYPSTQFGAGGKKDWSAASMAADIGAEEEFATTDEDIQKLGVLGGKPKKWPTAIDQANTNKMPGVLGGLTDAQKMAVAGDPYYSGQSGAGGGIGTSGLTDAQKMAAAGDPYYTGLPGQGGGVYGGEAGEFAPSFVIPNGTGSGNGDTPGTGSGNGVPLGLTKDTYKLEDVGFEISEADSDKKIGQILGTDKDPYNPAFPELSGVPAEGFIPEVIPEVPKVDNNDQYFKDAYANIYAQLESGNPYITLPDILDADGNIVPYYRDQKTTSQEIVGYDDGNPIFQDVTRTVKIVDPRYARLEMIYTNAQTQANWMAQQKQTALSGERNWMRDIIPFLTEPGVADILGLLGGGGVDPLFQPVFGQGFGLPSAVQGADMPFGDEAAEAQLPAMAQPAMQQRQHLPTESYLQRIGPDAVKGLQGLMGFMGQTPYDLQRMVGSVTPQFSGIFPGGGGTPAQITGRV